MNKAVVFSVSYFTGVVSYFFAAYLMGFANAVAVSPVYFQWFASWSSNGAALLALHYINVTLCVGFSIFFLTQICTKIVGSRSLPVLSLVLLGYFTGAAYEHYETLPLPEHAQAAENYMAMFYGIILLPLVVISGLHIARFKHHA